MSDYSFLKGVVLKGKTLDSNDIKNVNDNFNNYPSWLIELEREYKIMKEVFSVDEENDESGLGVEMKWMTLENKIEESFHSYPGICAIKKGYIPIGICLEGSGDPYFIKINEANPNLYRIPHDAIENDELIEDEVEFICTLEKLLQLK